MGTWGPGNFSDDIALDWLGGVVDALAEDIDRGMTRPEAICGHALAAQVEVLALLCEHFKAAPPKPEVVTVWRAWYLRTWEAEIDSYDPKPEYKAQRREVLQATFSRLASAAERWPRGEPRGLQDSPPRGAVSATDSSLEFARLGCPDGSRMRLYVQEGPECERRDIATGPDPDLIVSTVYGMEWSDISFVVLEVDNGLYFCVSGSFPDGFSANHAEGGREYICDQPPRFLAEMIALLQSYRRGDGRWRDMLVWG
jgi:hypothetical protein